MEHTCSYYCERPECIRAQREELRDRLEKVDQGGAVAEVQAVVNAFLSACDVNGFKPSDLIKVLDAWDITHPQADPALADALRQILGVTDPASSAYKIAAAALGEGK